MKKKIAATVLILGLTMTTVATAKWNGQRGNCDCSQNQMQVMQNLDPAIQEKVKQFRLDNQPLFKEMAMKRAEKRALMQSTNPDPKAAAQIAGEMFDLRTTIQLKASEAGVAQYIGPMNKGRGGKGGRGNNCGQGQQRQMAN